MLTVTADEHADRFDALLGSRRGAGRAERPGPADARAGLVARVINPRGIPVALDYIATGMPWHCRFAVVIRENDNVIAWQTQEAGAHPDDWETTDWAFPEQPGDVERLCAEGARRLSPTGYGETARSLQDRLDAALTLAAHPRADALRGL